MAWSKSADGARTIFTPGAGDAHPALQRLIYDPNAPEGARITAELTYFFAANDTLQDLENKLGVG